MNILVLKMAGNGIRFGSQMPKQFHIVNGVPIFCKIIEKYKTIDIIDKYLLVTNENYYKMTLDYASRYFGDLDLQIINGGKTGAETIQNAVKYLKGKIKDNDLVFLHDATNFMVVTSAMDELIKKCSEFGASTLCCDSVHAMYRISSDCVLSSVDKKSVVSGYSPELFKFKLLEKIYLNANKDDILNSVSAVDMLMRYNYDVKIVVRHFNNIKITYKEDFDYLKCLEAYNND